ncbi:MAG: serine/threonine protein kinase, partial [Candidatus Zixiibacteriota bacterium]
MQSMLAPDDSFGKYKLRQEIGQGGTGVVYLADDTESDTPVALKVLAPGLTASAEYREQLATEARLCASIDSPYVVRILDAGDIDGSAYVAMEYVAGEDLRTGVTDWDFQRKIELITQIGRGLHTAHQKGLVHRDLKPENIKLTEEDIPKILDFGLAREVDTEKVDEYGNLEGTLYYLSPEQLSGQPIAPASDIFSFGVICYELFTGCRPFEGEYSASVIYSILHEDPPQPSTINPDLPPWVDAFVMKLLAKQPSDRFQSVREAVTFLQANKDTVAKPGEKWVKERQTATVVDLKNLSGDPNWEYFCEGFTEDVIRELSRRTNLVVTGQPATSYQRNIKET